MAYIEFTDAIGAATLRSGAPAPGDRFAGWTPLPRPIGESASRLSDGATTMIKTRDQHGARFEVRDIPVATTGGVRPVSIAARLVAHLLGGGRCMVYTEDVAAHVYDCGIAPGSEPALGMSDAELLLYSLQLEVINLGSVVPMECYYVA